MKHKTGFNCKLKLKPFPEPLSEMVAGQKGILKKVSGTEKLGEIETHSSKYTRK